MCIQWKDWSFFSLEFRVRIFLKMEKVAKIFLKEYLFYFLRQRDNCHDIKGKTATYFQLFYLTKRQKKLVRGNLTIKNTIN